jgi:hypothetical protein
VDGDQPFRLRVAETKEIVSNILWSLHFKKHGCTIKYFQDSPVHNVLVAKYSCHDSGCEPGHVMGWPERPWWKHHAGVRVDGQGDGVIEIHVVQPPRICLEQSRFPL